MASLLLSDPPRATTKPRLYSGKDDKAAFSDNHQEAFLGPKPLFRKI
jgi:hypothetical protein